MADTLLDRLSGSHLPARWESEQEPAEPSERFEDRGVRGRSPDEVVQPREREYAETPTETTEGTPTPATGKRRRYVINGTEYALDAQQERALVEYGIKQAATVAATAIQQQQAAAQAQAAPAVITNETIAKTYDETAQIIITDLLANGNLLEEDLVELYPRTMKTIVGQMRFAFDKIFDNEFKQNQIQAALVQALERLEMTISWLNKFRAAIEGEEQGTGRRQDKRFVTGAKGATLLNKMIATSGRLPKAG